MGKIAKAIIGGCTALVAGVGSVEAAGHGVTATQWVVIAAGAVVSGLAVWGYPNAPQEPTK